MTQYYFTRVVTDWNEELLIVFEQGGFSNPVCILNKDGIKRMNETWTAEKVVEEKEWMKSKREN